MNENRKFYIKTWGCQMNVLDGEKMASLLEASGYERVHKFEEANIVILNTCSVREGPEERVFSEIFRLKPYKKENLKILGVVGCVAQQEGEGILKRAPFVDFVLGTHAYLRLPEVLKEVESKKVVDVEFRIDTLYYPYHILNLTNKIKASITVMEGCNKKCSFCIVPFTRGREIYRPLNLILDEVKYFVEKGYKEFELLGQNVNCYRDGKKRFVDLLDEVSRIEGVKRLRFVTSHPKHFNLEIADLMAERKNICKYLHLPMQAGSSRILRLMKRQYDKEYYLNLIAEIKKRVKDIALSSDFIVGFPTETEEEFEETLECLRIIEFDSIFSFVYSPRPFTPASKMEPIKEEIAKERLSRLQDLQYEIQKRRFERFIGKEVEVLLEGESKKGNQYTGRTDCNKVVNFTSDKKLEINQFYNVKIKESLVFTLRGEL